MPKFRPNVAALIIDKKGRLLVCERTKDYGAWQFPQGGIDKDETALDAMMRELYEEVGFLPDEYDILEYREEYYYFYPAHIRCKKKWDGQVQTYFLCQLKKKVKEVNLNVSKRPEFKAYDWVKPSDFDVKWLPDFKIEVYREVMRDFFGVEI